MRLFPFPHSIRSLSLSFQLHEHLLLVVFTIMFDDSGSLRQAKEGGGKGLEVDAKRFSGGRNEQRVEQIEEKQAKMKMSPSNTHTVLIP